MAVTPFIYLQLFVSLNKCSFKKLLNMFLFEICSLVFIHLTEHLTVCKRKEVAGYLEFLNLNDLLV